MHLVKRAMKRLERECESRRSPYHAVLSRKVREEASHEEIAREMGMTVTDVKNSLRRGRTKLSEYVADEVASYSASMQDYEAEIRYLSRFLDGAV